MSPLQEVSDWLDGPAFVQWLEDHGMRTMVELTENEQRRVNEWRRGGRANVYTADKVLTRLGRHLWELPDTLWADLQRHGSGHKLSTADKASLRTKLAAGESPTLLAIEFGISRDNVVYHRKRMCGQPGPTKTIRRSKAAA
jgi:hypothetical protein